MEVTKEVVLKTADNARLHITDEEATKYTEEINQALSRVKKIQAINTDGVERTIHGNTVKDVLRKDNPVKWNSREEAFKNAPDVEADQFRVPTVIE